LEEKRRMQKSGQNRIKPKKMMPKLKKPRKKKPRKKKPRKKKTLIWQFHTKLIYSKQKRK
jgi:hypothetical protein